ncbi:MAG: 2-hydroxycarboxylate transporter family protein [Phytoplasma sp.]|uniref:2-hydroxycarboxylate transporter family protein n=1 Tax=Phytoplasma sp. TaxID=2155 RepID=UPI002B40EB82|nr:2-hydroxycarboxylate transporter family protein [Phytoplasma sp.]WRH06586.1 MAG: 2-hydroxycarboxylate transporter family protein [Phytoplasma sp.]
MWFDNIKKIKICKSRFLIFLILLLILVLNIYFIEKYDNELEIITIWNPFLISLFFLMVLGMGLNFVGNKIPFFNKLGMGFFLCIFVPSYLVYKQVIITPIIYKQLKMFISHSDNGINFPKFFITVVVVGGILNVDHNLLKRFILKFIPLALLTIFFSFCFTGLLGYVVGYYTPECINNTSTNSFRDSIFFISVPLTNGGTNLGINGFYSIYQKFFGSEEQKIKSILLAPLLIARFFSIFLSGLLYLLLDKTELSGKGKLEKDANNFVKEIKNSEYTLDYNNIGIGLLIILGFYFLGVVINQNIPFRMDEMVYVIILSLIVKIFRLIPEEYQKYSAQVGKMMAMHFTVPMMVALGLTIDFQILISYMTNYQTILLVCSSLLFSVFISFCLAYLFNFYLFEFSLIVGISSYSIGSTGNIGVMSVSNRMELLPFAIISTRIVGALVFIITSFSFCKVYQ